MSERQEQIAVMDWWKLQYPKYINCLFAIPNGAHLAGDAKNKARLMAGLKAEGLKPGVSDLFLMVPRGGYHGFFLEMKDQGKNEKSLSENQLQHLQIAKDQGYVACWAAGCDDAIKLIDKYMKMPIMERQIDDDFYTACNFSLEFS